MIKLGGDNVRRGIAVGIGAATVGMVVVKARAFIRWWRDGVTASRKRIEKGNKPRNRVEEIKKGLGL